jgi:hypothetical protein
MEAGLEGGVLLWSSHLSKREISPLATSKGKRTWFFSENLSGPFPPATPTLTIRVRWHAQMRHRIGGEDVTHLEGLASTDPDATGSYRSLHQQHRVNPLTFSIDNVPSPTVGRKVSRMAQPHEQHVVCPHLIFKTICEDTHLLLAPYVVDLPFAACPGIREVKGDRKRLCT